MPIYKILIVNDKDKYSLWVFENFENEDEVSIFKSENEIEGDKITFCQKAESLIDSLSELQFSDILIGNYNPPGFYLKMFIDKFGIGLLKSQFLNELLNLDLLIDKVQELVDKKNEEMENELMETYFEDMENEYVDYPENPEIDAAEEEMKRWDNEDPSWRIAHDLD
jgi:hypothetical protein